jgi:hypothetical protein
VVVTAAPNFKLIKCHLWNGNVDQALELIGGLRVLLADDHLRAEQQKLLKAVREFGAYIAPTQPSSPTTVIATATDHDGVWGIGGQSFGEHKRMVKQQQMHWTERGAHLLLQVRAQVLKDELRPTLLSLVSRPETRCTARHPDGRLNKATIAGASVF